MEVEFFISFVAFLVCFLATLIGLRLICAHTETQPQTTSWKSDAFLPFLSITILAFILFFALGNNPQDQIFELSLTEFSITLVAFIGLYISAFSKYANRLSFALLLVFATLCSLLQPQDFALFQGYLPLWADRLCTIVLWVVFAWCFRYLNGIDGMATTQASSLVAGLFIISIMEGLPILYGNFSISFLGASLALLVYNWYPAKLMLKDNSCTTLGFMLGWLIILSAREGMGGCALIFITYYILEILWALGNKLVNDKGNFVSNTLYYQTNTSGLSPAITCQSIAKLLTILLVLGCFQVYAPNNYSLPIASAFITLWFMNKLHNWQNQPQSLKEINQEVIQEIKDNVENIKKIIR